jgi:hypothetical protein
MVVQAWIDQQLSKVERMHVIRTIKQVPDFVVALSDFCYVLLMAEGTASSLSFGILESVTRPDLEEVGHE